MINLDRSNPTPLYHQIERQLADQIQCGRLKPGSRLLPARELQRRLDVNFRTVLSAYNRLHRRGLVYSRQGSGTVVLEPAAKRWVGLLLFDPFAVETSPFYRLVSTELHHLLEEEGYALKLYVEPPGGRAASKPGAVRYRELLDDVRTHAVQGLIVMKDLAGTSVYQELKEARVPHVRIAVVEEPGHHGVSPDMRSCVRQGLEYLIGQGRRRIALLSGVSGDRDDPQTRETWGYEATLQSRGLSWQPRWLQNTQVPTEAAGYQAVKAIWSHKPRPDGLMVADDVMAKGACTALVELGVRVPDDLLLAVHANKGSGITYPLPMARVRFDPHVLARTVCDMLVQLIEHKPLRKRWVSVAPQLAPDGEHDEQWSRLQPAAAPAG